MTGFLYNDPTCGVTKLHLERSLGILIGFLLVFYLQLFIEVISPAQSPECFGLKVKTFLEYQISPCQAVIDEVVHVSDTLLTFWVATS